MTLLTWQGCSDPCLACDAEATEAVEDFIALFNQMAATLSRALQTLASSAKELLAFGANLSDFVAAVDAEETRLREAAR